MWAVFKLFRKKGGWTPPQIVTGYYPAFSSCLIALPYQLFFVQIGWKQRERFEVPGIVLQDKKWEYQTKERCSNPEWKFKWVERKVFFFWWNYCAVIKSCISRSSWTVWENKKEDHKTKSEGKLSIYFAYFCLYSASLFPCCLQVNIFDLTDLKEMFTLKKYSN